MPKKNEFSEKSNMKKLADRGKLTLRVGAEPGRNYKDEFSQHVDSRESFKLFHQRMTMDFLEDLLTVQQNLALQGDPNAIKFFSDRAWGAPPKGRVHVLENLTGVDNMEKLSKAYELGMQAMSEGKLTIPEWNDFNKALDSYSNHLEKRTIQNLNDTIENLGTIMIKICKASDIDPSMVLQDLDVDLKAKIEKNLDIAHT